MKDQGYRVTAFGSEDEAVRAAIANPPDLLVMGVSSRSSRSRNICRQLKSDKATNHIPIIFSGHQAHFAKLIDAVDYGADGYLLKPVETGELLAKVKSLIRLKENHEELLDANRLLSEKEDLLVRRNQELEALSDLNQNLANAMRLQDVIDILSDKTGELLRADRFFVLSFSESGTEVTGLLGSDDKAGSRKHPGKPLDYVGPVLGELRRAKRPMAIVNAKNSALLTKAFAYKNNLKTVLFLPLFEKSRVIGSLLICRDSAQAFSDIEFRLAKVIGAQASSAVARARLVEKSNDLQSTLKAVIEWGDSGIIMVDTNRMIRTANRKLGELLRVDHEKIIGRSELDCVVKKAKWLFKDPEVFEERLDWLRQRPTDVVTDILETTGPAPRTLERFSGPVFDGLGNSMGRVDIYHDVTTRRQSERRFRSLYKRERKIAQILQKNLLPRTVPIIDGFDIGTKYSAAVQGMVIGGDYYDFIHLSNRGLAFAIGDVCGKGINAAVQTYLVKYSLRAFAREDPDPAVVVSRLNWTFCQEAEEGAFVTLAYILLDQKNSTLDYCIAGHPQPLVYRALTRKFEKLGTNGGIVGVVPSAVYHSRTTSIAAGDIAVFYTDGITEARNPRGFFGEDNLKNIIEAAAGQSAQDIADMIFLEVNAFTSDRLNDDAAVVVLKRTA